tara:strand:- start:1047 stop:1520 length:474 start_codon:yes stop_codon:yes gene_type:complete
MNSDSDTRSPDIITFPSVIFAVFLIIGLITDRALSDILNISGYPIKFGFSFIILGVILLAWSWLTFATAKTCIDIRKSTKQLVTIGPYKYSRNPMYLAYVLMYLGISIFFGHMATLLLLIPCLFALHYFAIEKEENYLKARFGEQYITYRSRVRRWF